MAWVPFSAVVSPVQSPATALLRGQTISAQLRLQQQPPDCISVNDTGFLGLVFQPADWLSFADGIEDLALSTLGCTLIGDDRLGPTVPPQGFAEELQCCSLVAGRRDDAFWSVALVVDRPLRWRFNRLIVTRTSSRCQRR